MLIWIATLILASAIIIYWKLNQVNSYWKAKKIPHITPWPFVGNFGSLFFQRTCLIDLMERMYNFFPNERYFGMYQFLTPALVIKDLELLKRIMIKEFDTFPEHFTIVPEDVDPLFARNILFMKGGDKWQRLRSLLSPAFTSRKLKMMYPLMVECAKQFISHYEHNHEITSVEMKEAFAKYTNDVIGSTAFGVECNSFKDPKNMFYEMGKDSVTISPIRIFKMFMYSVSPALMKLLNCAILPKEVSDFFRKIVKDAIHLREKGNIVRLDMIHLLTEARKGRMKYEEGDNDVDSSFAIIQESDIGKQQKFKYSDISDEDLTAQAVIFFLAGFDTSSTALSFAAYQLAINPDIQRKLQKEIDDTLSPTQDEFVAYETLLSMKYLDVVVTETLRMWSPLTMVDRRAVKPFTIEPERPGETTRHFEAGTMCLVPVHSIHMDPKYYPNPKKFEPERFSDENKHLITPLSYLPFGMGPKSCIGSRFALLEVKLILFALLSKFDIVPDAKTLIPMVPRKKGFFLAAEGGMWLALKKRSI